MSVPDTLSIGQAWDDDTHGTQRVIVGFDAGPRVSYKVEVRHPLRGVEWITKSCYVSSFWGWVRRNKAHVR